MSVGDELTKGVAEPTKSILDSSRKAVLGIMKDAVMNVMIKRLV